MQLSLWHPKTCTHRIYGMSCEQFEGLRRRAQDLCEMCGSNYHPLVIDHDHKLRTGFPSDVPWGESGWEAVRGLICPKCNSHMRFIDNGERPMDERTQLYLDRAWHIHNLPAETFPTPDPEPPVGSVVRGPRGRVWRHKPKGWRAIAWPKGLITDWRPPTWLELSYRFGPENLHVVKRGR